MKKLFVLQTRFSLWNIGVLPTLRLGRENDAEGAALKLFDPMRLELRCKIFFDYSLPLIHDAYRAGFDILHSVLYSTRLPQWVLDKIEEAKVKYAWFRPVGVGWDDKLDYYGPIRAVVIDHVVKNSIVEDLVVSGTRLDDDDLLSIGFFTKLSSYLEEPFAGFGVSFPRGFVGRWGRNGFNLFSNIYEVKICVGISQINLFRVNDLKFDLPYLLVPGAHTTVDERVPMILDGT